MSNTENARTMSERMALVGQNIVYCLVGIILLTTGRRLFWLFVACAGFVAGFEYASAVAGFQSQWVLFSIAFATGLAGALLAILIQSVAIGVAGFLLGGYSSVAFLNLLELLNPQYFWPAYIVGGVVGLLLMVGIFDYALIFLSSIAGASLIVHSISLSSPAKIIAFLVLALAGAAFQAQIHPGKDR